MYHNLEKVGQGTYGLVYKAQNTQSKETVAIKRIKFGARDEGIPSSAIREIALLKELKHDNIIRLYDVMHSQHTLTLIFEFCEWDLKGYMQSKDYQIKLEEVISFSYQLLCGLEYIHSKNIIHRDIKPQNLLINKKLELKITDFGLARSMIIPVDKMSTEVVTQWYRPPEILLGNEDYGLGVDMWSAGCVIAEMVMGEPLFPCQNNTEMLNYISQIFGKNKLIEAFPSLELSDIDTYKDVIGLNNILSGCPKKYLI